MTPEYKAEILVDKFVKYTPADSELEYPYAKECAILAVNEILNEYPSQVPKDSYEMERHLYWIEVKKEIEKL
jgi:formaldehyde-activating enzyme involved in methanogenesis